MSSPSLPPTHNPPKSASVDRVSPTPIMENSITTPTMSNGSSSTALSYGLSDSDNELSPVKSGLTTPDWDSTGPQKFNGAKDQDSQVAKLAAALQLDLNSPIKGNLKRKRDACFDPVIAAQLESRESPRRQLRSSGLSLAASPTEGQFSAVAPMDHTIDGPSIIQPQSMAKDVVQPEDESILNMSGMIGVVDATPTKGNQTISDDSEDYHDIDTRFAKGVCKKVDGRWKAPEKCLPCRNKKRFCDRALPCSCCISNNTAADCIRKNEGLKTIYGQLCTKHQPVHIANNAVDLSEMKILPKQISAEDTPRSLSNGFKDTGSLNKKPKEHVPDGGQQPLAQLEQLTIDANPNNIFNQTTSTGVRTPPPKKSKTTKQPSSLRKSTRPEKSPSKAGPLATSPTGTSSTNGTATNTRPKKAAVKPKVQKAPPVDNRPWCRERPLVWASTRQELCETLPYYRAYQSGNYHKDGVMFSFLLDGFGHERDYIGNTCVITHPGGGSEVDSDGNRALNKDHTLKDQNIKATINNLQDKIPVVLLAGENNPLLPAKIGCRYGVLDWFRVTHIWPELEWNGKIRYKFRFEKLAFDEPSWWTPAGPRTPTAEDTLAIEYDTCSMCDKSSPYIYDGEWMCLKKGCENFWKVIGEDGFFCPPSKFRFRESFLKGREFKHLEFFSQPPSPLIPLEPSQRYGTFTGEGKDVSRACWKGFCCPQCGKLNRREFWSKWVCNTSNGGCGYEADAPRAVYDATYLSGPHAAHFTGPAIPANISHPLVKKRQYMLPGNLRAITYHLGNMGTVTHILANRMTNAGRLDADWMLEQYQAPEMPFRRNNMDNAQVVGGMLSQHFTFNSGEPYKYIIKVASTPFHESPEVVQRALELIHERVRMVQHDVKFNEILSVGYFEEQKMDWHDDGEKELGGTVASISLGAPAQMKFRVKKNLAAQMEEFLQHPVDNDAAGEEDDDSEFAEAFAEKPKKLSNTEFLDITLRHGDVVVMNGREIQRLCEHTVVPKGLFRIAATARFIHEDPNSQAK